jgi:hypothetical protein
LGLDVGGCGSRRRSTSFFGQILVEEGIFRRDDLRNLVRSQREVAPDELLSVGQLAVRHGYMTEARLLSLLDQHGFRLHVGELLVVRQLLRPADLCRAMRERRRGEMLGEALLRLGLIDPWALAEALAEQAGVACIPIHRIPVTPELADLVSAAFCSTHGLVPVALRGRSLILAIWRPQNLAGTEEVERATNLQVLPVLTTRRSCWSARGSRSTPAASRSSRAPRWMR